MKHLVSALIFILLLPLPIHAEEFNAGFVQGLWYSKGEIFAGDTVRIYVALRNNTEYDLTGTVGFTDNNKRIGTAEVRALPGRLVEAWTDWEPEKGTHELNATLSGVRLHPIGEDAQAATAKSTLAEDTVYVDIDTDGDNIGNEEDPDDDNDGVSDEDEIKDGTNPLVFTEEDDAGEDETVTDQRLSTDEDNATTHASNASASNANEETPAGFEKYTDQGTVDNLLTGLTNRIQRVKTSLDTYRENRNEQNAGEEMTILTEQVGTGSTTPEANDATITRSKLEREGGFMASLIGGLKNFTDKAYTFVLFALSKFLGHPALVQLLLLIAILFVVYRFARKLGSRPQ